MNIAVIGLGSMGKRRIRILKKLYPDAQIIGVETNQTRRQEVEQSLEIKGIDNIAALKDYNINSVCVCTSPLSHGKIINQCLEMGFNVFSEINLVDDLYDENIALAKKKNLTLFLSSTRLYRKETLYIDDTIRNINSKVRYIYHVGQYLPDWHPWEDYKIFFVSDKRTNGCREIMAIEFPWLYKVFGKITHWNVISDKMTSLDIDYPDCYMLQLVHDSGTKGVFIIDVVSRKAVRNMEIFGEDVYITWNGMPTGLYKLDLDSKEMMNIELYQSTENVKGYSPIIIENAYTDELIDFFAAINQGKKAKYDFEKDKEILSIIDAIENKGQ